MERHNEPTTVSLRGSSAFMRQVATVLERMEAREQRPSVSVNPRTSSKVCAHTISVRKFLQRYYRD